MPDMRRGRLAGRRTVKTLGVAGDLIEIPAPRSVKRGDAFVVLGDRIGIAARRAGKGRPVLAAIAGVFELPKAPGRVIRIGAPVFWDDDRRVADSRKGRRPAVLAGHAAAHSGAASGSVRVALRGPLVENPSHEFPTCEIVAPRPHGEIE